MGDRLGHIVVLNGTPRAGKSTIAKVIQDTFEGVWLNAGLEHFKAMTPDRYQPGIGLRPGGESPELEPLIEKLYPAMYEAIAAHSRRGVNVVADTTHHGHYSKPSNILMDCARIVRDLPTLLVGVRCRLDVVMERRIATWGPDWGYADDGSVPAPVLRWQEAAHRPGIYDLEVDTSDQSAAACAEQIRSHLTRGQGSSAFERLTGLDHS